MLAKTLITPLLTYCLLQTITGQELLSFRQTQDTLQIFYDSTESEGQWYDIRQAGIEYSEGVVICRSFLNESFAELRITDGFQDHKAVHLRCNDLPEDVSDCDSIRLDTTNDNLIGSITCLDSSAYNEGDIRQLEDGSIVQLRLLDSGHYVWGHFCIDENPDWDIAVSNLACQKLGYESGYQLILEHGDQYVFGLENINCIDATDFLQCISSQAYGSRRGCPDGIIAIQCEVPITTIATSTPPLAITTATTKSTTYKSSTVSTQISIPPLAVTYSTSKQTNMYSSTTTLPTTYNLDPTSIAFIEQYKIHVISGVIVLIIVLIVCIIGGIVLIAIAIHVYKSCHLERKIEEQETIENGESENYERYLKMAPYPNGDINNLVKPEQNSLYYNEVDYSNQLYQHTYVEMQPRQADTEQSTIEPLYTEIESNMTS